MGMPCEVNSILKLKPNQGYPDTLITGMRYEATKEGYRILPVDVPIPLVDESWTARADVIVRKLTWEKGQTLVVFEIARVYEQPFQMMGKDF